MLEGYEDRVEIYKVNLRKNGRNAIEWKLVEEMVEFLDGYIKMKFGRAYKSVMLEELGDLLLMLEQIIFINDVKDYELNEYFERSLKKLKNKLGLTEKILKKVDGE